MAKRSEFIIGLDVGTTKVCAIVAERSDRGIDITGVGDFPSEGLRNGNVVNMEKTAESLRGAVAEAELMAGVEINEVYLALSGSHVLSLNSHGVVAIKDGEVNVRDVERVIHAAKAVAVPQDRVIVEALEQEFIVDGNGGIKEPLGISGVRLEARVHLVTAVRSSYENVVRCCERAGIRVLDKSLAQLASSHAVLHDDEKELGVVLIDIGGGTTDVAVWHNGSVVHSAVIPVAGEHLTQDIAMGMRTAYHEAEKLKLKHGCAMNSLISPSELIDVPSVGGRAPEQRPRQLLGAIIEPRMEEILSLVQKEVVASGYDDILTSGAVITGGGSELEGVRELAEEVLGLQVRQASPSAAKLGGLASVVNSPRYATAVGLVLGAVERQQKEEERRRFKPNGTRRVRVRGRSGQPQIPGIWTKLKEWARSVW